jgi:hypothetical protein
LFLIPPLNVFADSSNTDRTFSAATLNAFLTGEISATWNKDDSESNHVKTGIIRAKNHKPCLISWRSSVSYSFRGSALWGTMFKTFKTWILILPLPPKNVITIKFIPVGAKWICWWACKMLKALLAPLLQTHLFRVRQRNATYKRHVLQSGHASSPTNDIIMPNCSKGTLIVLPV